MRLKKADGTYYEEEGTAAPQQQEQTAQELALNVARALGQGALFGFADEAEAFARSVLGDTSYEAALEEARAGLESLPLSVRLPAEIVGSIPSAVLGGAALQAARVGSKIAQAGIMGAGYGAGAAEEGDRLGGAVGGALIGSGLQKVTPAVTAGAKELMRRGVPVTIGQALGPAAKRLEEAATSVPFMGDVIKGAQRRAMERFGPAAYNEALSPVGKKISMNLTGREAYEAAESAISKSYDDVIKAIDLPAGKTFTTSVGKKVSEYAGDLPEREAKMLSRIINRELMGRIQDGRLTKQAFKDAQSSIRGEAYSFSTSTDPYAKKLGDALNDVAGEMFDLLAKEAPDLASQLKKVDAAYSRFVPLQRAAARAEEGIFTPAQVRSQIRAGGRRTPAAMARGELPMQRMAETAQEILGPRLPESGSAVRGLVGLGALGGMGAGAGVPLEAMALGGLASSLYTRPVQYALREGIPRVVTPALRTPAAAGLLAQQLPEYNLLGD